MRPQTGQVASSTTPAIWVTWATRSSTPAVVLEGKRCAINLIIAQLKIVLFGGSEAQLVEQSFNFPVSVLAGTHWVLQRNGVQVWPPAHPLILASGEVRNFVLTVLDDP